MMIFNTLYEKLENVLIGHYQFEKHEQMQKYQIMLLKILLIIGGFLIGSIGVVRLINEQFAQAGADALFTAVLGSSFFVLHRNRQHFKNISRFIIIFALLMLIILLYNLPDALSPVIWTTTIIYLMFFVLHYKEAWWWLIVIMSVIAIIYISGHGLQVLSISDIFILFSNFLVISLLLTWYEKIKEEHEKQYIINNQLLEERVIEKTEQLNDSNKALEALNKTLEYRIEKEIAKNREKDQIMLSQSRQAAMGDMISMIAHQWRQPITVIGMSATNMLLDIELDQYNPERLESKLNKIVKQTQYLSRTIDDFRDFLKPNNKPKNTTLTKIAEGALDIIGKSLENNNIALEKKFQSNTKLTTYPNELIQVLLNIINNAKDMFKIKQTDDGYIRLYTDENETTAIFKICDNAGGIPEEVLPRIFEPYFSTKESKGGTGLGLYMSKMIIEKHLGGTITGENSNSGACFTITLPIDNKESQHV